MTTLVTGAGGFLGKALVARLLAHGETDLRLMVRPGSPHDKLDALAAAHPSASIEVVKGNLASLDDAKRVTDGARTIYHLAASGRGAASDLFINTVVGSRNLLDAVVASGQAATTRMVQVSSFSVYGPTQMRRGALLDEGSPLEPHPERRDHYSHSKLRQEQLFWEYRDRSGLQLTVLRPGVIYGPGGVSMSSRVGLDLFGLFLFMGGNNMLPLTYVDNCAEAIAVAGRSDQAIGQVYNVVDDDLPTCREYLDAYQKQVRRLRRVRLPYPGIWAMSKLVQWYHGHSKGQLPDIFTPYKSASTWGGNRFTNDKLKGIGWRQIVPTADGMRGTFASLRDTTSR